MQKGLTIIELVLVVTITLILLLVVIFPFKNMSRNQALSKEVGNLIGILNNTRSMSLSSKGGVVHGVHFESNNVVLFNGSTYSALDPNNIVIPLHSQVGLAPISLSSGSTEIYFDQLKGTASATGTVTLFLLASTTQTKTITINSTGIIEGTP